MVVLDIKCRFCNSDAIAQYKFDKGCICYLNDKIQNLCIQHVVRSTPINSMKLIKILKPEIYGWFINS